MNKQAPGTRDQGPEHTAEFLRRAVPPVGHQTELSRDLWFAMQARLRQKETARAVPWFDWALAGGVALFALLTPAAIPVLFYYL